MQYIELKYAGPAEERAERVWFVPGVGQVDTYTNAWTVDVLGPVEPTGTHAVARLHDRTRGKTTLYKLPNGRWFDTEYRDAYTWRTWLNNAEPDSVKVLWPNE